MLFRYQTARDVVSSGYDSLSAPPPNISFMLNATAELFALYGQQHEFAPSTLPPFRGDDIRVTSYYC